ncbi:IclR family transcriptional regulator [Variovorax sp. WS11]|uniref:IclR family transcriptional regulator n=1 Tax=Variovorax sp. WS11 TaxID=1105204 RepID=UPI000D0D94D8|nr:helix-turn-helix domain-containing protein [Variovorax sp. WS11]NDZ18096.1 helix-turn-helix domain-containing protein [Variovorax sp. WS11]PSL79251.1 IclR family transcriptional regulator [Variovorax sp. WS11]
MPRRSAIPALADQNAAEGGIVTLDRALSLLAAFTSTTPVLALSELAERTQIYKSTVLRMLASLEHANLVHRLPDGRYALGSEVERLHQVFAGSFSLEAVVMPVLSDLVDKTRESAAFYVRQGDQRLCLYRVHSPRPVRDHMQPGDLLPLDRGAGGRILLAYSGAKGAMYSRIRREQIVVLVGDRVPELAGIGAPVFDAAGALAGALTLTMPAERLDRQHAEFVSLAARRITTALSGKYPAPKG